MRALLLCRAPRILNPTLFHGDLCGTKEINFMAILKQTELSLQQIDK